MHALTKIIARHASRKSVEVGEIVNVEPDYVMLHDRGIARVRARFEEMGGTRVHDPSKIIVVFDHRYPAVRIEDADSHRRSRAWMASQGITNFFPGKGIAHVVLPEKGFAFPGALIVGSDSHTVTNSGVSCFGTGMGHSDLGSLITIGYIWMRVPSVVKFNLHGTLRPWVSAKDVILNIIGTYGEDVCAYKGVEYAGPLVRSMCMDERLTLCNLSVEMGAKSGYIEPDEITWRWMEGRRDRAACDPQTTDSESDFSEIYDFDVSAIEPLVALPHTLSKVKPARELGDIKIDEAILGTCTGGRLEDFRIAASILKGRKVAASTRLIVNPASTEVYEAANAEGLIDTLVEAGADISNVGCGSCSGCNAGMLGAGEVALTTSSRNFIGRMGSTESLIYVASPATIAASAIAGSIVPAEAVLGKGAAS